ncbi:hypothetical protein LC612_39640, partial [Nostoc sp. CHAB 5834]|nr:hypothetical protein [Nostoc sp. CHAB 5834]
MTAVHTHLGRVFGEGGGQVSMLPGPSGAPTSTLKLELGDKTVVLIDCKFDDYAKTWPLEVLRLNYQELDPAIEKGWAATSEAHFVLYVSAASGMGTLIERKKVLDIQVPWLHALMRASALNDIPALLNVTIEADEQNEVTHASVGFGLLHQNILHRYQEEHGNDSFFHIDFSETLTALKYEPTTPALRTWAKHTLVSTTDTRDAYFSPRDVLHSIEQLVQRGDVSQEVSQYDSLSFFATALARKSLTSQGKYAPQIAGECVDWRGQRIKMSAPLANNKDNVPTVYGVALGNALFQEKADRGVRYFLDASDYI